MPKLIKKPTPTKPIRVSGDLHELFKARAAKLAAKRGVPSISLPAYLAEASQAFEDQQ